MQSKFYICIGPLADKTGQEHQQGSHSLHFWKPAFPHKRFQEYSD